MTDYSKLKQHISLNDKVYLTLEEASVLFNIGINKMRELCDLKEKDFVIWNGNKRLIKKQKLNDYLDKEYSI